MPRNIKSVCVYGTGGVGGYFGGRIAKVIHKGNDSMEVYFISRGEHLAAIQQQGLQVITDTEVFRCFPNIATDSIRHIPMPDLYLLCVKGYDLEDAARSIAKNSNDNTIILPLLNGVDIYERIRKHTRKPVIFPAAVYVSSSIEKPGTVRQKGPAGRIVFGQDPQYQRHNHEYVSEFFNKM